MADENMLSDNPPDEASAFDSILQTLLYHLRKFPPGFDEIKIASDNCKNYLLQTGTKLNPSAIKELLPLLEKSTGAAALQLSSLSEILLISLTDCRLLIESLLSSRDEHLVINTLEQLKLMAEKGLITIDLQILNFLSEKQEMDNSILSKKNALEKISDIIKYISLTAEGDYKSAALRIFMESPDRKHRILAAKILDTEESLLTKDILTSMLGTEAAEVLSPYLAYTCATHRDLLFLIPERDQSSSVHKSIKKCESLCGENIVREVIAQLGWKFVNYGLSVRRYAAVSFNGSLPLFVDENEARLFEQTLGLKKTSEYYIFTGLGGSPSESSATDIDKKPVTLFRSYNLTHANLLQLILDVAPLTAEKVYKIISLMDKVVDDFIVLFRTYTDECTVLQDVYNRIKNRVLKYLEPDSGQSHLSADLTRLVQMFEDPHSLGEVHSLHGLKRYLHQKGLQLGFKLVDQSGSPNRSIGLVLTSGKKVLSVTKKINYADFEKDAYNQGSFDDIPYSIRTVVNGFERQILYGQDNFPSVNVFCYGNEIHYFVWFRNHPVFIRIDYSPPLHGGMIDLKYFGVSNYEVADHPNIYLDAIRILFQYLEFDVKIEGTHIHARYDKERALDLGQLCERAEYLFCLVPYMMDLDWIIGSLNLSQDARIKTARAWAELFTRWGVLPIKALLTKDRLGIIQEIVNTPEEEKEIIWNGEGDYRDRYALPIPSEALIKLYDALNSLGLNISRFSDEKFSQLGQIYLENRILNRLRQAADNEEILRTQDGFCRSPEDLFQRIHEAVCFAEIMGGGGEDFESSAALAKLIIPLEQTLRFKTTGTLESFKVQTALIPLRGYNLNIFVLRDVRGIIRMAFFTTGDLPYKKRQHTDQPWKTNIRISPQEIMSLLRYNNYSVIGTEPSVESIEQEIRIINENLLLRPKPVLHSRIREERIITGLRASPGRAVGRVLLGISGRVPEDFNDRIFIASSISPNENTYLFHCAGIVATGGGILSHAGLIATQFNKPALIIAGNWTREPDGSQVLIYRTQDFSIKQKNIMVEKSTDPQYSAKGYNATLFYDFEESEYQMQDGDLVVLDTNEESLWVLGQDKDTITLFEGFKSLGRINKNLDKINDARELLILRGKKIHIRQKIEKILGRIASPVLAKFVIQEILTGDFLSEDKSTPEERLHLLKIILSNDKIGNFSEDYLLKIAEDFGNKSLNTLSRARENIPSANYPYEIVMPRLEALRVIALLKNIVNTLSSELLKKTNIEIIDETTINEISIVRLEEIRLNLIKAIITIGSSYEKREFLRHLFRQYNRINLLLNTTSDDNTAIKALQIKFNREDKIERQNLSEKIIITPEEGALELASMIGLKAANLAELDKLGGKEFIPSWFVITDNAFQKVLDAPVRASAADSDEALYGKAPLRDVIDKIISRTDIYNLEKSLKIKELWTTISLPEEIRHAVTDSYRRIQSEVMDPGNKGNGSRLYVATRSSSCEEDAEIAARAGEFETYLFINGEEVLLEYLKRTWSGLWTERAIHNRNLIGNQTLKTRGGVIVQKIVWSRVSGVLQTINVSKGDLKEIVINAGLGLGEGVVSGAVAADQIIVSKEGDLEKGPLHFNYITADKKDQVIFNKKAGFGTILSPTLYHQRFRPALEYVELCELVALASRLESAYGYPLDLEFGIEGTKLWILQLRPVATFLPAFRETMDNYPLVDKNKKKYQESQK